MNHHTNIVRLRAVATQLEEWKDKVIFVGGATVSLYASRPQAAVVRVTDDVDVVVELISTAEFYKMQERLLELGFQHDTTAPIISRFLYQGLKVDFMPTDPKVLGFSNRWYTEGVQYSIPYQLTDRQTIQIFSSPYFIASKMEAFKSRGKGDLFGSHDLEDIIFVLDNRDEIYKELLWAHKEVREYLRKEFSTLLAYNLFEEALLGNVEQTNQTNRKDKIVRVLNGFVNNEIPGEPVPFSFYRNSLGEKLEAKSYGVDEYAIIRLHNLSFPKATITEYFDTLEIIDGISSRVIDKIDLHKMPQKTQDGVSYIFFRKDKSDERIDLNIKGCKSLIFRLNGSFKDEVFECELNTDILK